MKRCADTSDAFDEFVEFSHVATVSYRFDSVEDGRAKLDHGRKLCVFGGSGNNLKMSYVVLLNSNIVLVVISSCICFMVNCLLMMVAFYRLLKDLLLRLVASYRLLEDLLMLLFAFYWLKVVRHRLKM